MSEWLREEKKREFVSQHQYLAYFCSEFVDADLEGLEDQDVASRYASEVGSSDTKRVIIEGRGLLASSEFPWLEVASCANRYFEYPYQCQEWLTKMLGVLEADTRT